MRKIWQMLILISLFSLIIGYDQAVAQAPRMFVSTTYNVAKSDTFYESRLIFGVRWRPCQGVICEQVGATLASDNFTRFSTGGSNLRHVAGGLDFGSKNTRVGISLGDFDQTTPSQPLRYYRFVAGLFAYSYKALNVTVEPQFFQFDVADVGTPIHDLRTVVRLGPVTTDVGHIHGHNVPQPYSFWTGTISTGYPPFIVKAGWVAVPDVLANRDKQMKVIQVGVMWTS